MSGGSLLGDQLAELEAQVAQERAATQAQMQRAVEDLVQHLDAAGLVLTVEQVPELPLAMGNYRTHVSVRVKRGAWG